MARPAKKPPQRTIRPIDIVIFMLAAMLIGFGVWTTLTAPKAPCTQPGKEHAVTLNGDAFSQPQLTAHLCDVVKVVNLDPAQNYELAFGVHPNHVSYPDFREQLLRPNEFIMIDLLKAGTFRLHDAQRDKAVLELTVIKTAPN